jgi:hypothetical protein
MKTKIESLKNYCNSLTNIPGTKTREVYIASSSRRIESYQDQSMTTTDTMNTTATVEQSSE